MGSLNDMPADKAKWPETLTALLTRSKALFGVADHPWPCKANGNMGACMSCREAATIVARVKSQWEAQWAESNKIDPAVLASIKLDLAKLPGDVSVVVVIAPHGKTFPRPKRGNATLAYGDRVLIRASKARPPRKRKSPEARLADVIQTK